MLLLFKLTWQTLLQRNQINIFFNDGKIASFYRKKHTIDKVVVLAYIYHISISLDFPN